MEKGFFSDFLRRKIFDFVRQSGEAGGYPSDATQKLFSRHVDVKPNTLSRLLHDQNAPSVQTVAKLVQSPQVGSEALAVLGIIPDDPRVAWLLDQVIQGKITPDELDRMIRAAQTITPDELRLKTA